MPGTNRVDLFRYNFVSPNNYESLLYVFEVAESISGIQTHQPSAGELKIQANFRFRRISGEYWSIQDLPEPSSLWGSTLGTRAAEHKGCDWSMQVNWWLQPRALNGHTFRHNLVYATEIKVNSNARLYRGSSQKIKTIHYITLHSHYITLHYISLHYITLHSHYITLHYITFSLHYITLHYIT